MGQMAGRCAGISSLDICGRGVGWAWAGVWWAVDIGLSTLLPCLLFFLPPTHTLFSLPPPTLFLSLPAPCLCLCPLPFYPHPSCPLPLPSSLLSQPLLSISIYLSLTRWPLHTHMTVQPWQAAAAAMAGLWHTQHFLLCSSLGSHVCSSHPCALISDLSFFSPPHSISGGGGGRVEGEGCLMEQ